MIEIYVNFRDHEHCALFNTKQCWNKDLHVAEYYIDKGMTEMLYNQRTGHILAESYFNDFKVLPEYLDRYTKENLKYHKHISVFKR